MTNSSVDAMLQCRIDDLERKLRLETQRANELENKLKYNRDILRSQEVEISDLKVQLNHKENMADDRT